MKIMFIIIMQTVIAVLAAELAAGAVHWFEDAYVREDTPVVGQFIARAKHCIHHHYPRHFTPGIAGWKARWDLTHCCSRTAGMFVLGAEWLLGLLTWPVWPVHIHSERQRE